MFFIMMVMITVVMIMMDDGHVFYHDGHDHGGHDHVYD